MMRHDLDSSWIKRYELEEAYQSSTMVLESMNEITDVGGCRDFGHIALHNELLYIVTKVIISCLVEGVQIVDR